MFPLESYPPEITAHILGFVNDPFLVRKVNRLFHGLADDFFKFSVNAILKFEFIRADFEVSGEATSLQRYHACMKKLVELAERLWIPVVPPKELQSKSVSLWQQRESLLKKVVATYLHTKNKDNYMALLSLSRHIQFAIPHHMYFDLVQETQQADQIWQLIQQHSMGASLDSLRMRCVSIDFLPQWITSISTCHSLNVAYNFIYQLPNEIGKMSQLTKINLKFNRLKQLPPSFEKLTQLKVLKLDTNKITTVPPCIYSFHHLTGLNLSYNGLKFIADEIGNLTQLEWLELNGNALEVLPGTIGKLQALRKLYVMNNLLKQLPDEIGLLSSLRYFYLTTNKIKKLPETLSLLSDLQTLEVRNNPLNEIPKGVNMLRVWWTVPK